MYSIWLYSLALHVTKKYEEDYCSSGKLHKTFNIPWLSRTYQFNFQIFESSKASRYYQIYYFKAYLFYVNDQLRLQVKSIFIKNESVNPYNTRSSKLLFITQIYSIHFGTKSLRYNDPLTWNNFSQGMNNDSFFSAGISKFNVKLLVIFLND